MKTKNLVDATIEVGLHNLTVPDGKRTLERTVMAAPNNVKEIIVIHGFHRGKDMLNMVRNQFKCRKVAKKVLTLNQGITILVLKREV